MHAGTCLTVIAAKLVCGKFEFDCDEEDMKVLKSYPWSVSTGSSLNVRTDRVHLNVVASLYLHYTKTGKQEWCNNHYFILCCGWGINTLRCAASGSIFGSKKWKCLRCAPLLPRAFFFSRLSVQLQVQWKKVQQSKAYMCHESQLEIVLMSNLKDRVCLCVTISVLHILKRL